MAGANNRMRVFHYFPLHIIDAHELTVAGHLQVPMSVTKQFPIVKERPSHRGVRKVLSKRDFDSGHSGNGHDRLASQQNTCSSNVLAYGPCAPLHAATLLKSALQQ